MFLSDKLTSKKPILTSNVESRTEQMVCLCEKRQSPTQARAAAGGRLGRSHFDLECEISRLEVWKAPCTGHQQV